MPNISVYKTRTGSYCATRMLLVLLVPSRGFEPRTNGLCLPLRLSLRSDRRSSRSLWPGLSLRFKRLPSSLYTFPAERRGLARDYHIAFATQASPNLADSTSAPETSLRLLRLECDTLATQLWRSYGKALSRLQSETDRQANCACCHSAEAPAPLPESPRRDS